VPACEVVAAAREVVVAGALLVVTARDVTVVKPCVVVATLEVVVTGLSPGRHWE
jgi:hypothetical protein